MDGFTDTMDLRNRQDVFWITPSFYSVRHSQLVHESRPNHQKIFHLAPFEKKLFFEKNVLHMQRTLHMQHMYVAYATHVRCICNVHVLHMQHTYVAYATYMGCIRNVYVIQKTSRRFLRSIVPTDWWTEGLIDWRTDRPIFGLENELCRIKFDRH